MVLSRRKDAEAPKKAITKAYLWVAIVAVLFVYLNVVRVEQQQQGSTSTHSQKKAATTSTEESAPTVLQHPPLANLTVLLDKPWDLELSYEYSIFTTGTIERFGTGRLHYYVRAIDVLNFTNDPTQEQAIPSPCLIVSRFPTDVQAWRQVYAKHCLFMHTADEFCKYGFRYPDVPIEVRGYDGANIMQFKRTTYLPLGPRHDTWDALQQYEQQQKSSSAIIRPPSQRGLVFNAIFSNNTSLSRAHLARILLNNNSNDETGLKLTERYPSFFHIARKWTRNLAKDHISQQEYVQILLNSTFTLAPVGHHPECYRLFEALEAGSVPIIALDEVYKKHRCKNA